MDRNEVVYLIIKYLTKMRNKVLSLKNRFTAVCYMAWSVCAVSCMNSADRATVIAFNPDAECRSIFDTGVIKDVKLIKLESDSCVIGRIDKIICNDSLLYIMDSSVTDEVFIFTKEGRFVNKISRQGHGRNEYTGLWDIFFDINRNALCLLSRDDQKVISFSLDGKVIYGESRLPKAFGSIIPTADGYVGYMLNCSQEPSAPYNVWLMDNSFHLLDGFSPIDPQLESRTTVGVNTLSAYGGAVCFKPEYTNTIYQIENGKFQEKYILDFGEKTFPDLSTVTRDNEAEWSRLRLEKVSNVYNYEETDDYVLMDFVMDGQFHLGIYDKRTKSAEITDLDSYEGDYLFSFGDIKGMDQSAIYSVVDYEGVYDIWVGHNKYNDFEKQHPKQVNNLRKLFPHLEEEGNPFIAIYSL